MSYALELENVCKSYPDFSLKNVSFQLPSGCIMGFIGENGAGKTTTIKSILDLITYEGTVRILGEDSRKSGKALRQEIGVVFDANYLPPNFNVRNLALIFRNIYQNWDDSLYRDYITRFSLPLDKKIKDFSKGMSMKLCIAVALAHHPRLLILDEATSGLDPVVRSEILDLFFDFIQDEGHSILLSSHITSDLEKIADYITFIHNGEIIFSKQKESLLGKYGVLKCGKKDFTGVDRSLLAGYRENTFGIEALVNNRADFKRRYPELIVDSPSLDEIMVFYGKEREI